MESDVRHTNELIRSTSPYLLQHAHNPVDWRLWSDEAFTEAQERDVPVFLSIGYSTCYWCHVMERESFESELIASLMNEHFVCIKLDREEHPELDELYMASTTIMTGSGGWPMSVFLEPKSRKPFWCGTYFPPEPMHGRPSFTQVLQSLASAYKDRRDEVLEQSEALADAVSQQIAAQHKLVPVGVKHIQSAVSGLLQRFDRVNGGFGGAPKFPQPVFLELLLDAREIVDPDTRNAIDQCVRMTLDRMGTGGIFDQVGGGVHRYSVDEYWLVPHFEKMLYDNAQLLHLYARAAGLYDDDFYKHITRRTADYVLREMRDQGKDAGSSGFFSAQDAEVNHREGQNYLWTKEQFEEVLDKEDAKFACDVYGINAGTNFRDPHHPSEAPSNVLRLDKRPDQLAPSMGMETDAFLSKLASINDRLYRARALRDQPGTDNKVLCSWNGMLISGLVRAGGVLEEREYVHAAKRCARFLLDSLRTGDGSLARSRRNGQSTIPAGLEDHAMLLGALLDLVEADHDDGLWTQIERLFITIKNEFQSTPGTYHDTRADRSDLFVRSRTLHDGATPSGVGMMNLIHARMVGVSSEDRWIESAVDALEASSASIASNPIGVANSTRALIAMMKMKDRIGDRYSFAGAAEHAPQPRSPVQVFVSEDSISVRDDFPGSFTVAIEINEGYHIVAADPGESDFVKDLIPLRVGLTEGQGIAVYAAYPDGTLLGESDHQIMINEGRIEFEVAIEKADGVGPTIGKPVLGITFQCCSGTECQSPTTVVLPIDVAIN